MAAIQLMALVILNAADLNGGYVRPIFQINAYVIGVFGFIVLFLTLHNVVMWFIRPDTKENVEDIDPLDDPPPK